MFLYLPWVMILLLLIPAFFVIRYFRDRDGWDIVPAVFLTIICGIGIALGFYGKEMIGQEVWVCSKEQLVLEPKSTSIGTVYKEVPTEVCYEYRKKVFTEDGWYYTDK